MRTKVWHRQDVGLIHRTEWGKQLSNAGGCVHRPDTDSRPAARVCNTLADGGEGCEERAGGYN